MNKIYTTILILMLFFNQKTVLGDFKNEPLTNISLKNDIDLNNSNILKGESIEVDCKNFCINANVKECRDLNKLTLKNSKIEDPNKLFFNSFNILNLKGNTQISLKNNLKINQDQKEILISGNLNIKGESTNKLRLGNNAKIIVEPFSNIKIKNLHVVINSPNIQIDPTACITLNNCIIEINNINDLDIFLTGNWILKNKIKIKNNFETIKNINLSSGSSSLNIFKNTIVHIHKQINIKLQGNPESFQINSDSILNLKGCTIDLDIKEKDIKNTIKVEKNSTIKTSGTVVFKENYNLIIEDKNLFLEGVFVFD